MNIRVLYFEGCPNHRPVVDRLRDLIAAHDLDAHIEEVEIKDNEQAEKYRFLGSPTVQVDREDIEPAARNTTDFAMSCRVYDTPDGLPSQQMLASVLGIEDAQAPNQSQDDSDDDSGDGSQCACCAPSEQEAGNQTLHASDQRAVKQSSGAFTFVGTVAAAMLSSACCWLPMALVLTVGVSSAGIATFFETWRPVFVAIALLMLGFSFYLAYVRQPKCADENEAAACAIITRRRRISAWITAVIVAIFVFYPSYSGLLFPSGPSSQASALVPKKNRSVLTLDVVGMTCAGCEARARTALRNVQGVFNVDASHEKDEAHITISANDPPTIDALTNALRSAGFKAEPK